METQEKIVTDKALSSILSGTYKIINDKLNEKTSFCIDKDTKHWWIGYETGILSEDTIPTIDDETNCWVVGLTTTNIKDNDYSYCTECINDSWFIGKDTGVVAEGKSITSITKDENDNLIVEFSDGSSANIGKLDINISADFLTENGFGKIRFYNGKFQYNNEGTWTDIVVDANNTIWTLTPQCMRGFSAEYNSELGYNTLTIKEPSDTVVDGQTVCFVDKVIIRRQKDVAPTSIDDGEEVMTIERKDFGNYAKTPFVDTECNAQEGDTWYYRAFPVSTLGVINELEENNISDTRFVIYGIRIDQNESDPDNMITYIEKNKNYKSAYMNFETDTFDYGDWGDIWFIKDLKPCMLKYDGTVDYELDKNDYSQRKDGGTTDISNGSYEGNAMIGIPKIYWKIEDIGDNITNVYFSQTKVDNDYHCWSHLDANGNEIDYCYIGIYGMTVYNGIGRSLSYHSTNSLTYRDAKTYTNAINLTDDVIWSIPCYSDVNLLFLLFMLLTKHTDFSTKIGHGIAYRGSGGNGGLNDKGLFYGKNKDRNLNKFLGIENLTCFGNCIIDGLLYDNGKFLYKYTYSNKDNTDVNGYNEDGEGYYSISSSITYSTQCFKKVIFKDSYILPGVGGGSNTTYWGNSYLGLNGGKQIGFGGNYVTATGNINLLYFNTVISPTSNYTEMTTRLACRPLAPIRES